MDFKDSALLAILDSKEDSFSIKRIVEDANSQKEIDGCFSAAMVMLTKDKTPVVFTGKYTPQEDYPEYLCINNFSLCAEIKSALINPMGLEIYSPIDGKLPKIKALFVGSYCKQNDKEVVTAAFQKFRNDQYITKEKHHLFFSENTFRKSDALGISISPYVDCVYNNGALNFTSYFYARQIFDLSEYYREATMTEVETFVKSDEISMEDSESFISQANSWERKKIASINDSGILSSHSAATIKSIGKKEGVDVVVKDKKIVLPLDKKERRILLGFLDEEVYTGAFSKTLFQTNSKRKAK